jgi:hypothetical protein
MNLYSIGYLGAEESPYTVLSHFSEITSTQLKSMVESAIEIVKEKNHIPQDQQVVFYTIFYEVIEVMVEMYNFSKISYKSQYNADEFDKV